MSEKKKKKFDIGIGEKDNKATNRLLINTSSKIQEQVKKELDKRKGGGKKN